LLGDCFELLTEREWDLSDDEAREETSHHCEEEHIEHALYILLHHVSHHVRVTHHGERIGACNFLIEISILFTAVVSLANL